jgi:DegV family protein with EDD domain
MSSTYSNACLAADDFDNVYVVDSQNLSTGGGLQVLAAAEMAQNGMDPADIVAELEKITPCVDASFVIDSLEYLHKGGRCSAVAMLGANLLKLKPCIDVTNGKMDVSKKYRGKYGEVLKQYVSERLVNLDDIDDTRIFITHAGCADEVVNAVEAQVKDYNYFKEVIVTRAGCTVSSHCGADTLGILYIRKSPKA